MFYILLYYIHSAKAVKLVEEEKEDDSTRKMALAPNKTTLNLRRTTDMAGSEMCDRVVTDSVKF
jgi:hypothetical protein